MRLFNLIFSRLYIYIYIYTSTEPRQISEILNNHFSTIGLTLVNKFGTVTSTITSAVCKDHLESGVMFAFDVIDECFVKAKLNSLKTNKAIGLDNISARLLKDSADVITTSLTKLYNRSLATSVFGLPSCMEMWKSNCIIQIRRPLQCQ